jgi:cellulose synthase/poly-beta-1,6-N-acetylglucosamine synthase-like glycosyltransferase
MIEILFTIAIAHFIIANLIALFLLGAASRSVRERWQQTLRPEAPDLVPSPLTLPLSAIVPAFNEQGAIVDSVLAILDSGVPELEIIVVDDGSVDETAARLTSRFDMMIVEATHPEPLKTAKVDELLQSRVHPNLWLIRKQNGGKADAVNAGANLARFRYLLVTDGDSIFEPGALTGAMTALGFNAGAHIGVGGMIRVRNGMKVSEGRLVERRLPKTMLEQFQVVEYMGAMAGSRAGWNFINGVPVISGAFGIWRRDVLLELGGMTRETTHEDIEFTFRVHEHFRRVRQPYLVTTLSDSVIWTEAPHRWKDLYLQRKRWQRVGLECMWRYRRMILNPRYGEVGTITMPYMLLFEALGPFMEVITLVLVVVLWFQGMMSLQYLALFLVFSAALVALTRIAAIAVDTTLYHRFPPRALLRLALVALLELFLYRPIILIARIMAFPEFLTGRKTWEQTRREPMEAAHAQA